MHDWRVFRKIPYNKDEIGVKRAGVFELICRDCDSKIFKEYENEEAYNGEINQEMMREIALKIYLKRYYTGKYSKCYIEEMLYDKIKELGFSDEEEFRTKLDEEKGKQKIIEKYCNSCVDVSEIYRIGSVIEDIKKWLLMSDEYDRQKNRIDAFERDMKEYKREINSLNEKGKSKFKIIYRIRLEYVVPIAIQDEINLVTGLDGELINDIFNHDEKINPLYLCVFPMKESTEIFMFIKEKSNNKYRKFIKKYNRMNEEDKMKVIFLIVLKYISEFILAKKLHTDIENNKFVKKYFGTTSEYESDYGENVTSEEMARESIENYSLNEYNDVPNIFSSKYHI